ncbi:hypothetical protein B0H34DRAFT_283947 [Crassisporium funariophilum]|nr:hypothetical protein B0H34DRAFT_283947 [Crassisporium funariophilum]
MEWLTAVFSPSAENPVKSFQQTRPLVVEPCLRLTKSCYEEDNEDRTTHPFLALPDVPHQLQPSMSLLPEPLNDGGERQHWRWWIGILPEGMTKETPEHGVLTCFAIEDKPSAITGSSPPSPADPWACPSLLEIVTSPNAVLTVNRLEGLLSPLRLHP